MNVPIEQVHPLYPPDPRKGDRVRLIHTTDEYTRLQRGAVGTVVFVDALGTLHVKWDDGSTMGLIPGVDRWIIIERSDDGAA